MKDPLTYTYDGLERELNLLEIHLKEAPEGDEAFCKDCIDKHISTARGFALEGASFTQNQNEINNFLDAEKKLREIKGNDYKEKGVEYAQKVREIRKSLSDCPGCIEELGNPKKVEAIKKLTKDLNNRNTFNNYLNKKPNKKMVTYAELGMMNAGQFAAEGIRYLAETNTTLMPYEKYVTIGGGLGLQVLGLFVRQLPAVVKQISLVAGSNLLAGGVVKLVKGYVAPAPIATVRAAVTNQGVGGYGGKTFSYAPSFGGPTFAGRVTAQNIPSQYARAGILAGAQAFEAPEHADLIRVD